MSEASAEIIRRANDAFRRGDWDAVSASIDPHVRVRTDPTWPEQRIYGQEAWIAFLGGESWGRDVRIEEIVDLGDRVLALTDLGLTARPGAADPD